MTVVKAWMAVTALLVPWVCVEEGVGRGGVSERWEDSVGEDRARARRG